LLLSKFTKNILNIHAVEGRITNKILYENWQVLNEPKPSYEMITREMVNFINADQALYPYYSF